MRITTWSCALLCSSLSIFLLTACGTTAVMESHSRLARAGETNKAKVYFLRPDFGYLDSKQYSDLIWFDGEELLTLAIGEYTLVYLLPGNGNMTVETMKVSTLPGLVVLARKIAKSEQISFEAGKTYHIAVCKQHSRDDGFVGYPFQIDSSYANQGSTILKAIGMAEHEPMSWAESISKSEASSILEYACIIADDIAKGRYDRNIQSDCVKVNKMLHQSRSGDSAAKQSDTTNSATSFCTSVVQQCIKISPGGECRNLIQSYDQKRFGSGTSLLMEIAATRSPKYDSGDIAFMRYLLGIGFNPNAKVAGLASDSLMEVIAPGYTERSIGGKWYDVTPLMIATAIGDRKMVEELLRSGADPNVHNDQGRTALMYAAYLTGRLGKDRASIAAALLMAGAKPDATSSGDSGATALMVAAHNGSSDLVRILLEHGANKAAIDKNGRTALEIAKLKGHTKVEQILQAH